MPPTPQLIHDLEKQLRKVRGAASEALEKDLAVARRELEDQRARGDALQAELEVRARAAAD